MEALRALSINSGFFSFTSSIINYYYQFHVRDDAVKTGGFQMSLDASI